MKKRIFLIIGLVLAIVFLAGCTQTNAPITTESEGFWNQYIVYPLSWFIVKVAEFAGGKFWIIDYYCHDYNTAYYFASYD